MTGKGTRRPKRRSTINKPRPGPRTGPNDLNDPLFPDGAAANENSADRTGDYQVGYGKPPQHSKFKPGVSPYPQGRKKSARGRKATFEMIAKEFVKIREGGRVRNMPREEALQRHLFAKAFTDLKAVSHLLNYMRAIGVSVDEETVRELQVTPEHKAIVAEFLARQGGGQDPSADDADEPEADHPASPKKEEDQS